MDNSCPNCNRISVHSGDCKHGNWYFKSYPTCLICGNPCPFETVSIGFGSEFDTGYLCAECTREYIDPAIKAAQQGVRRIGSRRPRKSKGVAQPAAANANR